jgi:hypothetical protein
MKKTLLEKAKEMKTDMKAKPLSETVTPQEKELSIGFFNNEISLFQAAKILKTQKNNAVYKLGIILKNSILNGEYRIEKIQQ